MQRERPTTVGHRRLPKNPLRARTPLPNGRSPKNREKRFFFFFKKKKKRRHPSCEQFVEQATRIRVHLPVENV